MASLSVHSDFIAISSNKSTFLFSRKGCDKTLLEHPPIKHNSSADKQVLLPESDSGGVSCEISPSGQYLVVCMRKCLYLWKLQDCVLLSSRLLSRSVSKIRFIPSERGFVVGDKSGDVYYYSVSKSDDAGTLLLGHLSVILDLLISPDERFIISSDRDEKIRVSEFPNCYNIHAYCLGHSEFVSVIKFLPHRQNYLLSGSGDGTIRLWHYSTGVEKLCVSLMEDLKSISPLKEPTAVTNLDGFALEGTDSLIACSVSSIPGIVTYRVTEDTAGNLEMRKLQYLETSTDPTCFSACGNFLWVLREDVIKSPLLLYAWVDGKYSEEREDDIVKLIDRSKNDLKKLLDNKLTDKSYDYLYKKKYDNVHEYLEKKKARLEGALKNT